LLVFDVEGTLFDSGAALPGTQLTSTIWQAIARALGPEAVEEEVATHERWNAGEYASYLDWMRETIEIHIRHRLMEDDFRGLVESAPLKEGALEFFTRLDKEKAIPVLVSGGFRALTDRAQRELPIRHAFAACDYFFGDSGEITGYNLLPCDFDGKIDFIRLMLNEYHLTFEDWAFVGDGKNDVPIATRAPMSIAYAAHPDLVEASTHATSSFDGVGDLLAQYGLIGED